MSHQRTELIANGTTLPSWVNRLSFGSGLSTTTSSNTLAVTLDTNAVTTATGYQQMFTSGNLDINGLITVTHGLNSDFPLVQIYSNNREVVLPDNIVSLNSNSIRVEMLSYGNIVGNWTIVIRK